jgi:hypothetical protein
MRSGVALMTRCRRTVLLGMIGFQKAEDSPLLTRRSSVIGIDTAAVDYLPGN